MLPRSARILFFNSLIVLMFDYADTVWGDRGNAVLMNNLPLLQNKAAKTISDRPFHSSATDAFEALGWLTLEKRRLFNRCLFNLLVNKDVHGNDTRHEDNLRLPRVRRNWGKQRTHYQAAND